MELRGAEQSLLAKGAAEASHIVINHEAEITEKKSKPITFKIHVLNDLHLLAMSHVPKVFQCFKTALPMAIMKINSISKNADKVEHLSCFDKNLKLFNHYIKQ